MTKFNIPENIINTAKKRGKQLSNLINNPQPGNYEVGQIWSTFQSLKLNDQDFYTDEPKLVVILTVQQDDTSLVSAAPISTETYFASEYDLIISKHDSPLGFGFMIEVWNETPVHTNHLKKQYGSLSESEIIVLKQIYSLQLFSDSIPETLFSWVGLNIFGEEDPRLAFQEKEVMAISYLAEAATFNVSLSLSVQKESLKEPLVSELVFTLKPIFDTLSNFGQLMSRELASASSEYENKTYILASPDEGNTFIFELQEGLPSTKELFLVVHFITKDIENKKCYTKIFSEKSKVEFPSFVLKKDMEVKVSVDSDFSIVDISDVEVKVE
jgi:hypothetical protein